MAWQSVQTEKQVSWRTLALGGVVVVAAWAHAIAVREIHISASSSMFLITIPFLVLSVCFVAASISYDRYRSIPLAIKCGVRALAYVSVIGAVLGLIAL